MREINIVRIDQTEHSTISKCYVDGRFICFVLEDGEHENKIHGSTRIPGGRYKIRRDRTTKFRYQYGYCWWLQNVPNFTEIKIHKGNWIKDTEGCLLPNKEIGFERGNYYGINSKRAYDALMAELKFSASHWLDVIR